MPKFMVALLMLHPLAKAKCYHEIYLDCMYGRIVVIVLSKKHQHATTATTTAIAIAAAKAGQINRNRNQSEFGEILNNFFCLLMCILLLYTI